MPKFMHAYIVVYVSHLSMVFVYVKCFLLSLPWSSQPTLLYTRYLELKFQRYTRVYVQIYAYVYFCVCILPFYCICQCIYFFFLSLGHLNPHYSANLFWHWKVKGMLEAMHKFMHACFILYIFHFCIVFVYVCFFFSSLGHLNQHHFTSIIWN